MQPSTVQSSSLDRFVRLREVLTLAGIGKSTLYKMIKTGEFPAPIQITKGSVGWWLSAVTQWQQSRPTAGRCQ